VAVVGGSLGSRRINEAALDLYPRWRARADVAVRHVTGRRDYQECVTALDGRRREGDRLEYRLVPYEDHMESVYARTTVMVCRAGGMVAELLAVGMPAILVPLPDAPGDHQAENARRLVADGAAVVVADGELDGGRLAEELDRLLGDPGRLAAMSASSRALGRPNAAARLADLVEAVARGER
jgi:UDP-N-acetylglucosamine:LPS N-acetylglucosamine transferase